MLYCSFKTTFVVMKEKKTREGEVKFTEKKTKIISQLDFILAASSPTRVVFIFENFNFFIIFCVFFFVRVPTSFPS